MKRLILIAILSSSIASMSCNTDRGTILNMPFFSVFGNKSAAITSFAINGVVGTINGTDITLTLPCNGVLNDLAASFTITGDRVEVNDVEQENGVTRNDFTNPVVYTVYTKSGSSKDYTVYVTIANYSAKDITLFSINGINAEISGTSISLVLPYGTNPSSLVATYNTTGREVRTGGAIQISGVTPNNFSSPRTYTVEACDGSTRNYTVTVTVALSSARDITGFSILGINGTIGTNTITLTVPYGTDLTDLTPTITHTGESVSPDSGESVDFTDNVEYTVTAANGTTKVYTVTVTAALNNAKDITSFSISGIAGTIGTNTIALTVPYGTSRTNLTPSIIHTGASISPIPGIPTDFTNPVNYAVTAANGTTKVYTVTVTVAANPAKDITGFTIMGINGTIGTNTITLTVPYGTDCSSLTPTIIHTGASIDPASGVPNNFTIPAEYTVTAADSSTKVYTVTVSVAPSNSKNITGFSILGINGTIGTNTITLTVPYGTDRSSLTPTITHSGASISPASGVANNFTGPAEYTVTAADNSTKVYTVTVTVAANPAKDITGFTIMGINGTIGTNTITLTVPYGTNRASLTPTITHTGASISPASGVPNNFTIPAEYTVTAADNSTKVYTVTVSVAPGDAKDITTFSILGINGTIGSNTITINLPYGTDKSCLIPAITHTGASINPALGSTINFTNPVDYTVTAIDTTTQVYNVTVTADYLMAGTYAAGYYHNGSENIACLWNISEASPVKTDLETSTSTAVSVSKYGNAVYVAGTYGSSPCFWTINGETKTRTNLSGTGDVMVVDSVIVGTDLYISGTNDINGSPEACYWKVDLTNSVLPSRLTLDGGAGAKAYEITESGGTIYIAGTDNIGYNTPCYWTVPAGSGTQHFIYSNIAVGRSVMIDGPDTVIGGWFEYNPPFTQALSWAYSGTPVSSADELPPDMDEINSSSVVSSSLNMSGNLYFVGQQDGFACYWLNGAVHSLEDSDVSYVYEITRLGSDIYMTGYNNATQPLTTSTGSVWIFDGSTITPVELTTSATGEAAARDVFVKD